MVCPCSCGVIRYLINTYAEVMIDSLYLCYKVCYNYCITSRQLFDMFFSFSLIGIKWPHFPFFYPSRIATFREASLVSVRWYIASAEPTTSLAAHNRLRIRLAECAKITVKFDFYADTPRTTQKPHSNDPRTTFFLSILYFRGQV